MSSMIIAGVKQIFGKLSKIRKCNNWVCSILLNSVVHFNLTQIYSFQKWSHLSLHAEKNITNFREFAKKWRHQRKLANTKLNLGIKQYPPKVNVITRLNKKLKNKVTILRNDSEMQQTFINYFVNILDELGHFRWT